MTNEELLEDFKQFVRATVSQEISGLESRMDERFNAIDDKLNQVQDGIADALTHATEATDATLQDHEKRLQRLERRTA